MISLPLLVLNSMKLQKMRNWTKISQILALIKAAVIIKHILNLVAAVHVDDAFVRDITSWRDCEHSHSHPHRYTSYLWVKRLYSTSGCICTSNFPAQHTEPNTPSYRRSDLNKNTDSWFFFQALKPYKSFSELPYSLRSPETHPALCFGSEDAVGAQRCLSTKNTFPLAQAVQCFHWTWSLTGPKARQNSTQITLTVRHALYITSRQQN